MYENNRHIMKSQIIKTNAKGRNGKTLKSTAKNTAKLAEK